MCHENAWLHMRKSLEVRDGATVIDTNRQAMLIPSQARVKCIECHFTEDDVYGRMCV